MTEGVKTLRSAAAAPARDLAAGEVLCGEVCRTSHGPEARGPASFARLAGHEAAHIETRPRQHEAGETIRPDAPPTMPAAGDL